MTEERIYDHKRVSREEVLTHFLEGPAVRSYIADHFPKYALLPYLGRFLSRAKVFERVLDVPGSVVECGVGSGFSLFSWFQLSKLLEPLNRRRIIYGFDTFEGFPHVSDKDGALAKPGDLAYHSPFDDLTRAIEMQTTNYVQVMNGDLCYPPRYRGLHDWDHIRLFRGDFLETVGPFMTTHSHLVVSLLHLDFDLYDPTKRAIEVFLPRMPKGAVICFDEVDHPEWPGETLALIHTLGINHLRLRRLPWEGTMAYAVIE